MKKIKLINSRIFSSFLILAIGICMGFYIARLGLNSSNKLSSGSDISKEARLNEGYKLINPLLECDNGDKISSTLIPFKDKVDKYVLDKINSKEVGHISVYFRDLNNGPWFGIEEKETFIPASMIKVPIMMAALKVAETDPEFLKRPILYEKVLDSAVPYFKPIEEIRVGQTYTMDELIYRMIVYSDNNAKNLVVNSLMDKGEAVHSVFDLLGGNFKSTDFSITVKSYASFFRILFNASYLNKEMSEKALEILSKTSFDKGLDRGVPGDVVVADKFGERWNSPDEEKQLHSCGVVYHPVRPYLICVMSRGDSFDKLARVISDISRLVYDEVERQSK
jgi:beta-lactamase class A